MANVIQRVSKCKDGRSSRAAIGEKYAEQNRACAQIILQDLERYGGPDSLMGRWAHAVLFGIQKTERAWRLVA